MAELKSHDSWHLMLPTAASFVVPLRIPEQALHSLLVQAPDTSFSNDERSAQPDQSLPS